MKKKKKQDEALKDEKNFLRILVKSEEDSTIINGVCGYVKKKRVRRKDNYRGDERKGERKREDFRLGGRLSNVSSSPVVV